MSDAATLQRVQEMHERCHRIQRFTAGLDRGLFFQTAVVFDATMWNLLIIGEAANHLTDEITGAFPDIPWRQLVGFRNRLAHEYATLDDDTIWFIVSVGIGELVTQLRDLLDELAQEETVG